MASSIVVAIITATGAILAALIGALVANRNRIRHDAKTEERFEGREYLAEPLAITSERRNSLRIESEFLRWPQCTIMMWAFVPPKNEGLRNSDSNRYLLAHCTGIKGEENWTYFNQFAVRHTSRRDRWEVQISNGQANYPPASILAIGDGLASGWHQFVIAWDITRPVLTFAIDSGKGGNDLSTSFRAFWPEELDEKVTVGGWSHGHHPSHYCETKLFKLWILDDFADPSHVFVKQHLKLKPHP